MILAAEIVAKKYSLTFKPDDTDKRVCAEAFCEFFAQTNSQFDREQFLKACGL